MAGRLGSLCTMFRSGGGGVRNQLPRLAEWPANVLLIVGSVVRQLPPDCSGPMVGAGGGAREHIGYYGPGWGR